MTGQADNLGGTLPVYDLRKGDSDWGGAVIESFRQLEQLRDKAERTVTVEAVLAAAGWTGEGPYEQTVQVEGMTGAASFGFDLAAQADDEQDDAYDEALIRCVGQGEGAVSFRAKGRLPGVDIPVTLVVWG